MDYYNDILMGLKVASQIPLDAKLFCHTKDSLIDLGIDDEKAFSYYRGMIVYCSLERESYEWRESDNIEVGLLPNDYIYPDNVITDDIIYSNKAYNFYKVYYPSNAIINWVDIANKPTTFPPSAHVHDISDITGLIQALLEKENKNNKNVANGYAGLNDNNKIDPIYLPEIIPNSTYQVNSEIAMLNLVNAVQGDVVIRTDINSTFKLKDSNYNEITSWVKFLYNDKVTSVFGRVGDVTKQYGDYYTTDIIEIDKYFQTLEQKNNNDATSSIQNQLDNKQSKINTLNYSIDFYDLISQNPFTLELEKREIKPEFKRLLLTYTTIYSWGDSFVQSAGGVTPWTTMLTTDTKFDIINKGVGGETSTQIKNRFVAEPLNYDKTVIIWAGRNNLADVTTVKADIATMVSLLTHDRYFIISVTNGVGEGIGTSVYDNIISLNNDLQEIYGDKFIDIRSKLISLHNDTIQDLADFVSDIVPTSLRVDGLHLNFAGNTIVKNELLIRLGNLFGIKGYFQSKDFKYYLDTYLSNYISPINLSNILTIINSIAIPNKNIYTSFARNSNGIDIVKQMTHFWNGTTMQALTNTPILLGIDSGKNSTAGSVALIAGNSAGLNNAAPFVGAIIGVSAGENLKGSHYGGIFGASSAQNQDGNDVGLIAGTNSGQYAKLINIGAVTGTNAALYAILTNVGGVYGTASASRAILINVGLIAGADAGAYAIFSNSGGIIGNSGTYNEGSNNIFGYLSHVAFIPNVSGVKNIANNSTDINIITNRITITAHGFGANNTYTNLKYSTTGSAIGGLVNNNIYQVQIIDANTLFIRINILTSIGTGVHSFTPQFKYTNLNLFGNGIIPTANNQTIIGNNETEQFIARGRHIIGSISDDGVNALQVTGNSKFTGITTGYVYKIDQGYLSFPSNSTGVATNEVAVFRQSDKLGIKGSNTNNFVLLLDTNSLTAIRTLTIPNESGTIAIKEKIKDNIITASNSTITLANNADTMYYTYTGSSIVTWNLPPISGNEKIKYIIINAGSGTITLQGTIWNSGTIVSSITIISGNILELYNNSLSFVIL